MYELIQHQEVGAGGASSITFSSIPQTYTDLFLVVSARNERAYPDDDFRITINNNTSVAYSNRRLWGNGSGTGADGGSDTSHTYSYIGRLAAANATASTFGNTSMHFSNYTSSNAKLISTDGVIENNGASTGMGIYANLVDDTNPITSIKLEGYNNGTLLQYTTATLYGIGRKQAIGKPKAVGGAISYDNGYWVHTFTGSGTFYAQEDLDLEYLVVAGGGGGAGALSANAGFGGGGAGGYRSSVKSELSGENSTPEDTLSVLSGSATPVVIGAGGAGGAGGANNSGVNGIDSFLGTIQSLGGGFGSALGNGGDGGSGGGARYNSVGGSGTTGQGFKGGDNTAQQFGGPSGGGAGAAGAVGSGSNGATGGIGIQSSITGTATYRAGGGGGGSHGSGLKGVGGQGGGGDGFDGATATAATAGSPNTGGGGGAANGTYASAGAAGGSGIVIVRYRA